MLETLIENTELMILVMGLISSVFASAVSALFPDKASVIMKFVNLVALNVGKAKNTPKGN